MAKQENHSKIEKELLRDLKLLTKEVKALKNLEFVQVLKKPGRLMWLSLLKGMMTGLGSVLGATVLVAILLYIIAQISFVPIIGDFIKDLMSEIGISQAQP